MQIENQKIDKQACKIATNTIKKEDKLIGVEGILYTPASKNNNYYKFKYKTKNRIPTHLLYETIELLLEERSINEDVYITITYPSLNSRICYKMNYNLYTTNNKETNLDLIRDWINVYLSINNFEFIIVWTYNPNIISKKLYSL